MDLEQFLQCLVQRGFVLHEQERKRRKKKKRKQLI